MDGPSRFPAPRRGALPAWPCFQDETAARALLESLRWPEGDAICPHCRPAHTAYRLQPRPAAVNPCRRGLWKCSLCRRQFTVTIGTLFESARLPLHKWLAAAYLYLCVSKPCDAKQLQEKAGMSRKTAYAILQRLAYARSERKELSLDRVSPPRFERAVRALLRVIPEHKHPLAAEHQLARLEERRKPGNGFVK